MTTMEKQELIILRKQCKRTYILATIKSSFGSGFIFRINQVQQAGTNTSTLKTMGELTSPSMRTSLIRLSGSITAVAILETLILFCSVPGY